MHNRYDAKDILKPILTARKRNSVSDIFIGAVLAVTVPVSFPVRCVPTDEGTRRRVDMDA